MGPQQPVFARSGDLAVRFAALPLPAASDLALHEPLTDSRVVPQCVFAAGKKSFTAFVRGAANTAEAKVFIYDDLPLSSEGWTWEEFKVRRVRALAYGTVYLVERR